MRKTLLALAFTALLLPLGASATATSWDYSTGVLQPLQSMWAALVKADHFQATSTTASIFPYASTTAVSATALCLSSDCRTVWPSAGMGTVTQVNTTYPVLGGPITTTGTLSLAFGTTTPNTWAGTQTFTNAPVFSSLTGILKGNGSSAITVATPGTDYAPATSGSSLLYGNGSGGFSNATVGTGLDFTGGTLSATGGGTGGGLASSTPWTPGQVTYVKDDSSITSIATSTPTVTAPLAYSGTLGSFVGGTGGAFSIPAATGSQNGYLTSSDWTTFNGKQTAGNYITALTGDGTASGPGSVALTLATVNSDVGTFNTLTVNGKGLVTAASNTSYENPLTFTYPLTRSTNTIALAFGTTTSNTWDGTQTFTNNPILGSLSGIIYGNSGVLSARATTTASCAGTVSCTGFDILGSSPITITGAASSGNVATSTTETAGQLPYWTSTGATPATLGKVATTSLAFSGPFNGTSALGALVGGVNAIVNWTGLATTSQPASSNLLVSNGAAGVYGVATTTASCSGTGISCSSFSILGSTPVTITGSGITGTGVANRVTYWSGTSALTSTADFTFNGTGTLSLGITGGTEPGKLVLFGNTGGSATIQADTSASGTYTISLPAATGTLCLTSSCASSVSNSDSTLTISPTTGAVVASLNLGHANTFTARQTASFSQAANDTAILGSDTTGDKNTLYHVGVEGTASGDTNNDGAGLYGYGGSTHYGSGIGVVGYASSTIDTSAFGSTYGGYFTSLANMNTNSYGGYFSSTNSGTGKAYGVYSAGGLNYFSGNTGIGTTTPYKLLSIGGDVVIGASTAGGTLGDLYIPKLGTATGAFLAVDATGKVIATTTPSGGSGTVTSVATNYSLTGGPITTSGTLSVATSSLYAGTTGQFPYFSGTNTITATSSIFISTAGNVGIGSTSPSYALSMTNFWVTALGKIVGYDTVNSLFGTISPISVGGFKLATTTTWTGTTTEPYSYDFPAPFTGTVNYARCYTDTGTLTVRFTNSTAGTNAYLATASTTANKNTINLAITEGDKLLANAGNPASTPTWVTCALYGTRS